MYNKAILKPFKKLKDYAVFSNLYGFCDTSNPRHIERTALDSVRHLCRKIDLLLGAVVKPVQRLLQNMLEVLVLVDAIIIMNKKLIEREKVMDLLNEWVSLSLWRHVELEYIADLKDELKVKNIVDRRGLDIDRTDYFLEAIPYLLDDTLDFASFTGSVMAQIEFPLKILWQAVFD